MEAINEIGIDIILMLQGVAFQPDSGMVVWNKEHNVEGDAKVMKTNFWWVFVVKKFLIKSWWIVLKLLGISDEIAI